MQKINSIRNADNYYNINNLKQNQQIKQITKSPIMASTVYHYSGLNALGNYNQASVSFEGLGIFKKLADKIKDKKEAVVAKHQQKKEEKLQRKEEKLQSKQQNLQDSVSKTESAQTSVQTKKEEPQQPKEVAAETKPTEKTDSPAQVQEKPVEQKKSNTEYDMGFYENTSAMKYLKMTDKDTGVVTIDWYSDSGALKGVQTKYPEGKESYITFYDKDGKMIKEEFITLSDGKHQYIRYRKNGLINTVSDIKEDNKTLIKIDRYHYKDGSDKLDRIRTVFEDKSAQTQWYRDDETIGCKQFEKDGKVTKIHWYFEDGKTVRVVHVPLENGGIERSVYDKEGKLLISDITKADKSTSEEITNYYYKDNSSNYYKTRTTYEENKTVDTWYSDDEVATCSIFKENGIKTKSVWYFEDGETPNIEELYLSDGRTQKVTMDKAGRWIDFVEFSTDNTMKSTHYIYEGESEGPQSSVTTYTDGKTERVWYDENETMTCRQTKENNLLTKLEWFHKDGVTPKLVRTYAPDMQYVEEQFDENGNSIAVKETVSA